MTRAMHREPPWRLSRTAPRPQRWWRCTIRIESAARGERTTWAVRLSCVRGITLTGAHGPDDVPAVIAARLAAHAAGCTAEIAQQCATCDAPRRPGELEAEEPTRFVCRDRRSCADLVRRSQDSHVYREGWTGPTPRPPWWPRW